MPLSVTTLDTSDEIAVRVAYGTCESRFVVFKSIACRFFGPIRILDTDLEGCVDVAGQTEKVQAASIALETARQLEHTYPEGSPVRGRPESFAAEGNYALREHGHAVREVQHLAQGLQPSRLDPYVVYDEIIPDGVDEIIEVINERRTRTEVSRPTQLWPTPQRLVVDDCYEAERQALIDQMTQPSPRWWVDDDDDLDAPCLPDPWGSF